MRTLKACETRSTCPNAGNLVADTASHVRSTPCMQDASGVAEGYSSALCGPGDRITCLAQSPATPHAFAVARADGSVRLAHMGSLDAVAVPPTVQPAANTAVTCCTFDASGAWLIAASRGGQLRYYSLLAQEVSHRTTVRGEPTVRTPLASLSTQLVLLLLACAWPLCTFAPRLSIPHQLPTTCCDPLFVRSSCA